MHSVGKELAKHTDIELCLATGNDASLMVHVCVFEYIDVSVLNFRVLLCVCVFCFC